MLPGLLNWDFVNPFKRYFFNIVVLHISRVVNRSLAGLVGPILFTELYYSWNRNTAVLLYNLLSGHGERKWLAHMINPYYNSL